jgi:hypothetical protein
MNSAATRSVPPKAHDRWAASFVGAVILALSARLLRFVTQYAVNVLFLDQWAFYTPLFKGSGLWAIVRQQCGPVREGAGLLVSAALAWLTRWNMVIESQSLALELIAATVLLIVLNRRLAGRIDYFDVAIPVACLSLLHFETIIVTPNPAHSTFPLLLLCLTGISLTCARTKRRLALEGLLTILLLFSGFSIFAVPPMLALIALIGTFAWHRDARGLAAACFLSTLAIGVGLVSFAYGYDVVPALSRRVLPAPRPWSYLVFISAMLGNVFWMPGWSRSGAAVGWLTFAVLICVFVDDFRRIAIDHDRWCPEDVIGFLFTSFTLLFCLATAVGRLPLFGLNGARAPRYATLQLPGVMAIYFHIGMRAKGRIRHALLALFVVWMSLAFLPLRHDTLVEAWRFYKVKRIWVDTYRDTSSIIEADRAAGRSLVPARETYRLPEKLEFLRANNLSFFADRK